MCVCHEENENENENNFEGTEVQRYRAAAGQTVANPFIEGGEGGLSGAMEMQGLPALIWPAELKKSSHFEVRLTGSRIRRRIHH